MGSASPSHKGYRYPVAIISHCAWLHFRFPLSFREVEELVLERGVIVPHETVRRWCAKFGQVYAHGLRRWPRTGGTWHLDEVLIKIMSSESSTLSPPLDRGCGRRLRESRCPAPLGIMRHGPIRHWTQGRHACPRRGVGRRRHAASTRRTTGNGPSPETGRARRPPPAPLEGGVSGG